MGAGAKGASRLGNGIGEDVQGGMRECWRLVGDGTLAYLSIQMLSWKQRGELLDL